jgi:hypothetical protein
MNSLPKLALVGMCVISSLAAQSFSAHDPRVEGTWRLSSERSDDGSLARLPAGSVMTITQDGGHIIVRIADERGKTVTSAFADGGPVRIQDLFSPDAKTLTQTTSGTDSHTGRPYRITRVWQKQGTPLNH